MPFFFPDRFMPGERFCLKVCSEMVQLQWAKWSFLLVYVKNKSLNSKIYGLAIEVEGYQGNNSGQWLIFNPQSLWKFVSRTIYENKLLRFIIFSCSLKDLSLVYRLWKFQFSLWCIVWSADIKCFPEYLESQIPHSSSLALHLLIKKRILGTLWPLLLPQGCVPRRQTCVVSWVYRLGWAGAKGLHRVLWGGMEKRPWSLTSSKYGIHWEKAGWVLTHPPNY